MNEKKTPPTTYTQRLKKEIIQSITVDFCSLKNRLRFIESHVVRCIVICLFLLFMFATLLFSMYRAHFAHTNTTLSTPLNMNTILLEKMLWHWFHLTFAVHLHLIHFFLSLGDRSFTKWISINANMSWLLSQPIDALFLSQIFAVVWISLIHDQLNGFDENCQYTLSHTLFSFHQLNWF